MFAGLRAENGECVHAWSQCSLTGRREGCGVIGDPMEGSGGGPADPSV